jgi:outer membrane protein assembly factor BamB
VFEPWQSSFITQTEHHMKKWHRHVAGTVAAVLLTTAVFAEDWPQWRGPNRDGKVTGFTPPATWPKALAQKWKITVGDGDATPALVGDRIYVFTRQGADEVLTCLNAADGKDIWKKSYPATATVTGPAQGHPGPRSSPAVANGKVVTLGVAGILTCWNASNGDVIWKKTEPKGTPGFFTASSPLIVDGLVIAQLGGHPAGMMGGPGGGGRRGGPGGPGGGPGGGRGTPPPIQQERPGRAGPPGDRAEANAGGGTGAIMAFELASGNEKWKWTGESPSYSSPIVATIAEVKQIIAPTERSVVSVSIADGKLLWQVPSQPQRMTYNAPTPIVEGDMVFITGYGGGTRAVKISKQGDIFSANEAWNNSELGTTFNTPVLKDGYLYGLSSNGALFCINAKDGKTAWTGPQMGAGGGGGGGGGRMMRAPNFGAIVDAGSVLIALPSSSELIAFKPSEKAYEEVARIKVSDSQTYTYPVLSGNKVIVKDQQSVAMLAIE